MHASYLLLLLLPLASPCAAPQDGQEPAPPQEADEAQAPAECAYLTRRRLKLEPERGSLARADALLALGMEYRGQGIGGESLMNLRRAEELYFAGFDASIWSPEAARFSLARGETARLMKLPKEAVAAYARAVVLVGDVSPDESVPGTVELDELLVELDAVDERDALLAAARDDLIGRHHAELLRGSIDRPAPALGDATEVVTLYWFWSPRDEASRAELERVLELSSRWSEREDARLVGVLLPEPEDAPELDEAAKAALQRATEAFPQVSAGVEDVEAFLVFERPAAAVVDAQGTLRYASSGAAPFTIAALERAAVGLLLD